MAAGIAALYVVFGRKPWSTQVAQAIRDQHPPPLHEAMQWGFWWGGVAVALGCLALATTHRWWSRARPATIAIPRLSEPSLRLGWWVGLVAVLIVATVVHRWPRLSHSLWGDESLAMAAYMQDHFIAANPERKLEPLKLKKVPWAATWFGDWETGNNHHLFTILGRFTVERWRAWTGRARHEFDETMVRLPALIGGLGLLVAMAALGRRLGAPRAGLAAAAWMALHPWHLRYSTEARGYSLMGLFLCLAMMTAVAALESGAWSAWLLFASLQFLSLYSCKLALYPLLVVNLLVGLALWRRAPGGQPRVFGLARWLVSNTTAGLLFILLYAPCHPQALAGVEKIRKRGQTDLSPGWALDTASETLTGIPWRVLVPNNPVQIAWSKYLRALPETGGALGAVVGGLALVGLAWMLIAGGRKVWGESRPLAWALVAFSMGWIVMAIHLLYDLRFDLLPWYGFFLVIPFSLVAGIGLTSSRRWPGCLSAAGLAVYATGLWPQNRSMVANPYENLRGAMEASRGLHESPYEKGTSRIYTCWLWRSSALYDPRGNTKIRTLPMLNYAIRETEQAMGELYVIIGYPELARTITPTVYARVTNDPSFEKVAEFPAQVPRHTLLVYRWVSQKSRSVRGAE